MRAGYNYAGNNPWIDIIHEELFDGDTFTCPWGHTVDINDKDFIIMFKFILLSFENNSIERLSANPDLKTVDAYIHWITNIFKTADKVISTDVYRRISLYTLFPNAYKENSRVPRIYETVKTLSNINQDSFTYNLNKKIELEIDNNLLRVWDKYKYLTPQLFAQTYNYNYIDVIGNQLPLDNYKLYQSSSLFVKTWIGSSEQNISYYQGKIDENNNILEPRYVNKFALAQPIEFSRNVAEITYQLRKNQLDAKVAETQLARARDVNHFRGMTDAKIELANSQLGIDKQLNEDNTTTQNTYRDETKDIGRGFDVVNNLITGAVQGAFLGKSNPIAILGGLFKGAIDAGADYAKSNQQVEAANQLQRDNTTNLNTSLTNKNNATVRSYQMEQNTNVARLKSNAQSQLRLLQGEIADIKNLPNQTMNVSNITKMLSIEKGEISIISESLNEVQQKEMFKFWNKHGVKNWRSISTKNKLDDAGNIIGYRWYHEFSLFDYFQGGDWTKYLNNIGVYNIEIIQEFNMLMTNGLRLHHQSESGIYGKLRALGLAESIHDINHDIPNWPQRVINHI